MQSRWVALLLTLAVLGCAKKDTGTGTGTTEAKPGEQLTIAVIPKGTKHEFWKSVHAGADRAAKDLGVTILWNGPLSENDKEGQIDVVQGMIIKEVDGICLAPLDAQALVAAVKDAKAEKIPAVIFDSDLADNGELKISYVATDNYNGGSLAARELGKRLNGKGNVILLRYLPGSESTEQRERGFLDTLKKEFPGCNIISSEEYAGATEDSALSKSQQLLVKHRDAVNGIFAVNEPATSGMLQALKENDMAGKVVFIGFDSSERLAKALQEGHLQGMVVQDPVQMGYKAVATMVDHLQNKKVNPRVATGEHVITQENMQDEATKKLLQPEQLE